jgi:hypothetical protein
LLFVVVRGGGWRVVLLLLSVACCVCASALCGGRGGAYLFCVLRVAPPTTHECTSHTQARTPLERRTQHT